MTRRPQFRPDQKLYDDYYGKQAGYGLSVFKGSGHQRGGGLGNFLAGLGRTILPLLKQTGKSILKEGVRTGVGTLHDVVSGKKLKDSLVDRSKAAGKRLLSEAVNTMTSPKKRIKQTVAPRRPQLKGRQKRKKKKKKNIDIFS